MTNRVTPSDELPVLRDLRPGGASARPPPPGRLGGVLNTIGGETQQQGREGSTSQDDPRGGRRERMAETATPLAPPQALPSLTQSRRALGGHDVLKQQWPTDAATRSASDGYDIDVSSCVCVPCNVWGTGFIIEWQFSRSYTSAGFKRQRPALSSCSASGYPQRAVRTGRPRMYRGV